MTPQKPIVTLSIGKEFAEQHHHPKDAASAKLRAELETNEKSAQVAGDVSVFKTIIRDLGGLLSAYDWNSDKAFLTKAIDLEDRLLHSFDCNTIEIPCCQVSSKEDDPIILDGRVAEFGTIQLDFKHLAKAA